MESYPYGFNGKEKDSEIKGEGNSLDFGGRIYDSRLGRWLSVDPKAKEDPDMSPYNSMGNNPIMFIDPDGKKIIIPNVKDREAILKMINAKSQNIYAINEKTGELYLKTKVDKAVVGHSKYYSERLEKAIKDDEKIWVQIGQKYKDEKGKEQDVDTKAGGGVTLLAPVPGSPMNEKVQLITISGNENKNLKDVDGASLRDEAADILLHEFVGHAIPKIVGKDTGNAVENENKARKEENDGYKQRKAEPDHVE